LYVRNLPFGITDEDVYDIFGKYGAIRQIRVGNTRSTKGTAYVVYEDIYDAKAALEKLSGFNVANRYLIVLYYKNTTNTKNNTAALAREEAALKALQKREGVSGEQQK
jgi:pre-mRNA branch site protein p14